MAKKVNGFTIKHDKKNNVYLVKDRAGYTASSKPNIKLAIEWAKKDRRYVGYEANVGGLKTKCLLKKQEDEQKNINKKLNKLKNKLKK